VRLRANTGDKPFPTPTGQPGHPPVFTLAQRLESKKIAQSRPAEHRLPFSRRGPAKLARCPGRRGVVEDISQEGLRELLRAGGCAVKP